MTTNVRVGVAAIIIHQGKILLGERIGSHGANTWATPGGHLEFFESVEQCAKREVFEETGLNIHSIEQLGFTNDIFNNENKHYITLYVIAKSDNHQPKIMEPNKCKGWQWFELSQLPTPLFEPMHNLLADQKLIHELREHLKLTNDN